MARWTDAASGGLTEVKSYFRASDAEMQALRTSVARWADQQANDATGHFNFKGTRVHAQFEDGWIVAIHFGD